MNSLTIENLRRIVEEKNASLVSSPFKIKRDEQYGWIVFDYNFIHPGLFKDEPNASLLRECRGLLFSADGKLLSRPYHKFFNLGELDETKPANLSFDLPHKILEKLDGSMVRPVLHNDNIIFATRAGSTHVSKQVDEWANNKKFIHEFCFHYLEKEITPIFEWCSRKQRIVLDYPQDRLVLTGLREHNTGKYLSLDKVEYPDIVKSYDLSLTNNLEDFLEHVRELKDMEGYVIRWDHGLMVKVKADEYIQFHRIFSALHSEKSVVELVNNNILDDALAKLSDSDKERFQNFQIQFNDEIAKSARTIAELVKSSYDRITQETADSKEQRKRFALEVAKGHVFAPFLFTLWLRASETQERLDEVAQALIHDAINKGLGDLDKVRPYYGNIIWNTPDE